MTVDHCTLWPEGWGKLDWSACCAAHDVAYGLGLGKLTADVGLARCVARVAGWPMAIVMFAGVTVGGWAFWRRTKRGPS